MGHFYTQKSMGAMANKRTFKDTDAISSPIPEKFSLSLKLINIAIRSEVGKKSNKTRKSLISST